MLVLCDMSAFCPLSDINTVCIYVLLLFICVLINVRNLFVLLLFLLLLLVIAVCCLHQISVRCKYILYLYKCEMMVTIFANFSRGRAVLSFL